MHLPVFPESNQQPPQRVIISKIHITVKFSCRLNLEYRYQGSVVRTKEIRIDPREQHYLLEQQIKKDENIGEGMINVMVKLISNKGVSFTAGIIPIHLFELPANTTSHRINIVKGMDPASYCQCRCISHPKKEIDYKESRYENNSSPVRYQHRQYDEKAATMEKQVEGLIQDSQQSVRHKKISEQYRIKTNSYSAESMSSDYSGKVQFIEAQLHRSNLKIQKQNQIISMLEADKKVINEELTELKIQLKSTENDLDQKRYRIRELDSEKLNLMMNAVTTDKEISFLKQRSHQALLRAYQVCKKLLGQDDKVCLLKAKQHSLSNLNWPKEVDQSYKLPNTSHKFYSKQDLPWQEQSQIFKEQAGLLSSCHDEFSISNIEKQKQQPSLGHSEHLLKANHTFSKPSLCEALKAISDHIRKYCHKIEKMMNEYHRKTQKQMIELKEHCQSMQKEHRQFEVNQQSLLNQLEELEGGLQSRIAAVAARDEALFNANQHIEYLETTLAEKDSHIAQLEAKIANLEEEKDEIQSQLNYANYQYAQKQQKLLASLTLQKPLSLVKNHSLSPKVISREKRNSMTDFDNSLHKNEIIMLKEQIRALELEISHKQTQHQDLQTLLRKTESELSKCQFTMHLKERMNSLNESIELSQHSDRENQTKPQEDFQQLFKD